jgi:hypothetical protein
MPGRPDHGTPGIVVSRFSSDADRGVDVPDKTAAEHGEERSGRSPPSASAKRQQTARTSAACVPLRREPELDGEGFDDDELAEDPFAGGSSARRTSRWTFAKSGFTVSMTSLVNGRLRTEAALIRLVN